MKLINYFALTVFLVFLSSCSQNQINDIPIAIILLPAIAALSIVCVMLYMLVVRQKTSFDSARKNIIKNMLTTEIARAKRHDHKTGVLVLDIKGTAGRGIHYFLPGKTVDVEHVEKSIRQSDKVLQQDFRRYFVILSHLAADNSVNIIKERMNKVAEEKSWPDAKIGVATFPADGDTADDLIRCALEDMDRTVQT